MRIITATDEFIFGYGSGSYYIFNEDSYVEVDPVEGRYIELELISTKVNTKQPLSNSDYTKEIYKRLYHNLPLLLKSKGTERSIEVLLNSFGIPREVLPVKVFGNKNINELPNFGDRVFTTSSYNRINLDNTGSILEENTLSENIQTQIFDRRYIPQFNEIEVGFSPTDDVDSYIKSHPSMSSFNIDNILGDPRNKHNSEYSELKSNLDTVLISGSRYLPSHNVYDYSRILQFYNNSVFRMIKDFVPSRDNVSTGFIVKPNVLDRSKIKEPEVKWSNQSTFLHTNTDLEFTGSLYGTNFSIEGDLNIGSISGSDSLEIKIKRTGSINTTGYNEIYFLPSGGFSVISTNNFNIPSFNGELSGSVLKVTNRDLNLQNLFKKLKVPPLSFKFKPILGFETFPFTVNSVGQNNPENACGATKDLIVYGRKQIFQQNTEFFSDVTGETKFTEGTVNNWFSNGLYSVSISSNGSVSGTTVCATPVTRYPFLVFIDSNVVTACSKTSPEYTPFLTEGIEPNFIDNTYLYSGTSDNKIQGNGNYYVLNGEWIQLNGSLKIDSGSCQFGTYTRYSFNVTFNLTSFTDACDEIGTSLVVDGSEPNFEDNLYFFSHGTNNFIEEGFLSNEGEYVASIIGGNVVDMSLCSSIITPTPTPSFYQYYSNRLEFGGYSTSDDACTLQNGLFNIYSSRSSLGAILVGDTLYSDLGVSQWQGDGEWYGLSTTNVGTPTYSFKISNTGEVLEVRDCSVSPTPTPTPTPNLSFTILGGDTGTNSTIAVACGDDSNTSYTVIGSNGPIPQVGDEIRNTSNGLGVGTGYMKIGPDQYIYCDQNIIQFPGLQNCL